MYVAVYIFLLMVLPPIRPFPNLPEGGKIPQYFASGAKLVNLHIVFLLRNAACLATKCGTLDTESGWQRACQRAAQLQTTFVLNV